MKFTNITKPTNSTQVVLVESTFPKVKTVGTIKWFKISKSYAFFPSKTPACFDKTCMLELLAEIKKLENK